MQAPLDMISEEPTWYGEHTYTARRNPGSDPVRYQVFAEDGFGPAGYLELFYSAEEYRAWRIRVFDAGSRLLGHQHQEPGRPDLASVHSYHNALAWIREAGRDAEMRDAIRATEPKER